MARFIKLPESLKAWKITSQIPDNDNLYRVSKKNSDGTQTTGLLRYAVLEGDDYNDESISFAEDECAFLLSVTKTAGASNYRDVAFKNNESKRRAEIFIITAEYKSIAEVMKSEDFDEAEIIDFGIKMSSTLERLEERDIFHGNIHPDNIFVTDSGEYVLGGFSDYERKIEDLSFIAPEIHKNEPADYTTDIYSLGLIMYTMCNNGRLPFEADDISRDRAINRRFDGAPITAPSLGSEKLRSVIVIACQAENSNRWKNATNIKNALMSIKGELPSPAAAVAEAANIVVPERTDFDENVFDEYGFDEITPEGSVEEPSVEDAASAVTAPTTEAEEQPQNADDNYENTEEQAEDTKYPPEADAEESPSASSEPPKAQAPQAQTFEEKFGIITESTDDDNVIIQNGKAEEKEEITEDVFDNASVSKPQKSFKETALEKDYGDYFDEEAYEGGNADKKSEIPSSDSETNEAPRQDDFEEKITDTRKIGKNGKILIAASVVVMLAALGFIAFCIINAVSPTSDGTRATTEPTAASTEQATAASTTEPETTAESTTAEPTTQRPTEESVTVTNVVGYGYVYAKSVLEGQGFKVEQGATKYSDTYDAGYVIAQSPSGNTQAAKGDTITLDVSIGREPQPTTVAPTTRAQSSSSSSSATSSSYILPTSNSAYLSRSQVSQLSRSDLTLAINEIYARRGRIFEDDSIREYFESKTWYTPRYTEEEFIKYVTFNDYEQANLNLLVDERKERASS